jgi:hypothetical protein
MRRIDQLYRGILDKGQILNRAAMVDMGKVQSINMKPAGDMFLSTAKMKFGHLHVVPNLFLRLNRLAIACR